MADLSENNVQWYTNQKTCTASFSQKKFVKRFKQKYVNHPDVQIVAENSDGSICVHFPLRWLKISPPRRVSEEQRAVAAQRLKQYREENK